MTALLVTLVAAADVTARPAEDSAGPRLVIDLYPVGMTAALLSGVASSEVVAFFPISATWAFSRSVALHAELSFTAIGYVGTQRYFGGGATPGGFSFDASVGPLISLGSSALNGFCLCPKLGLHVSDAVSYPFQTSYLLASNGPLDLGPTWTRAFLVGLDVGYQWTWGGRHLAVMVGASGGYGYDVHGLPFVDALGIAGGLGQPTAGPGRGPPVAPEPRDSGFVCAVNANLFRIGFAL